MRCSLLKDKMRQFAMIFNHCVLSTYIACRETFYNLKIGFNNRNNQGCLTEKITSLDGVVKVHKKVVSGPFTVRNVFTYNKNCFTYSEN